MCSDPHTPVVGRPRTPGPLQPPAADDLHLLRRALETLVSVLAGVTLPKGPASGQQGPREVGVHADGGQRPVVGTHSEDGCLLLQRTGWLVEKGREVGHEAPFPFSFALGELLSSGVTVLLCVSGPHSIKGQGFYIL